MNSDGNKIRIVVADDQTLFAHMLKALLESRPDEFEVVGLAFDGQEALEVIGREQPDVVFLDVKMPVLDGISTARELTRRGPRPRIIMLTTFENQHVIQEILRLGVAGYILKDCDPGELFAAVRSVHAGLTSISSPVTKSLLTQSPGSGPGAAPELNRREREILELVVEGLQNHEIADRLFIAEQTVKNYISGLYSKFDVKDRTKLLKLAEQLIRN